MTNRIAILLALVLGGAAAFAAHAWMQTKESELAKPYEKVAIVVARRTLRPGTALRVNSDMLGVQMIPHSMLATGMVTREERGRFRGYIVNERVEAGHPLFRDKIDPPYERAQTQASLVEEGMRAVTINVDLESGVAGLIRTGDRVDLIATFDLTRGNLQRAAGEGQGVVTLYLLQNARVVALDNRSERVGIEINQRDAGRNYRAVTLEVAPDDALRIVNAQEQGEIRLLLRNRGDVALQPQEIQGRPIGVNVIENELDRIAPHTAAPRGGR